MRSRTLFVILFAAAIVGCGKGKAPDEAAAEKPAVAVQLTKASRRSMRQILDLSGAFAPAQGTTARLTPAVSGRLTRVLVREGDKVRKGQLLATLDTSVQQNQQSSAMAALQAATAQADQSQLTSKAAATDQQNAVRSAQIALQQAQLERQSAITQTALNYKAARADLAKTKAGARPQEVAQVHEATVQAQATRDRASSEYRRNLDLSRTGYVSRRQLEDAKTALDTAESALTAARASESLVLAGSRPEEVSAAEARTAAARESMESAQTLGRQKVAAAEAALKQARDSLATVAAKARDVVVNQALSRQKASDVASAAATTSLGEIRAPYDGIVTRRLLNPGDSADPTGAVLEIETSGAHTDFVATALPNQAQLVQVGMSAQVELDGDRIEGRVANVSLPDPQTNLSSIRILVGRRVLTGTYSTAHVVLSRLPNALAVPDSALLDRDGKVLVCRDVDGVAKQTEIKVGPEEGGFTAVLSGLKEGDSIVDLGGYELDDGTKITAAPPKEKGGKE